MNILLKILKGIIILFVLLVTANYFWMFVQNINVHNTTLDWQRPKHNTIGYVIKEIERHGYTVEYKKNLDKEKFHESSYATLPSGDRNLGYLLDNIAVKFNLNYNYGLGKKIIFESRDGMNRGHR